MHSIRLNTAVLKNNYLKQQLIKIFVSSRWGEGLAFSVHAYNYHTDIFRMTGSEDFSLQKRHLAILADLRRKALVGVSRAAYRLFEENNVSEALKQANSLLVPGLGALAGNPCDGDTEVLEAVREEWCQYLTHPGLSDGKFLTCIYTLLYNNILHDKIYILAMKYINYDETESLRLMYSAIVKLQRCVASRLFDRIRF